MSSIAARLPDLEDWKAQVKCQAGCPVATDAGRYVQLIGEGRDEEAFLVARAPNPFASVCGRVCAAPCEDACRRGAIDAPIAIRALKRHLTERYGVESSRPDTQDSLRQTLISEGNRFAFHLPVVPGPAPIRGAKIAVVGAGPAGLSAAHDLALLGYRVTVFDAAAEAGGMMRFGIPEYRLPRALIQSEINKILELGVELRLNTALTPSFGLPQLKAEDFQAVFVSVGVSRGRDLNVPGVELDGVVKAVDYLLNVNRGYRLNLGQRVVVVGGGFVAFDAARTALRVGQEAPLPETETGEARLQESLDVARAALRSGSMEVTVVSLENFEEMPVLRTTQGKEEFEEAKREGIRFVIRRGPVRFLGEKRLQSWSSARCSRSSTRAAASPDLRRHRRRVARRRRLRARGGAKADLSSFIPAMEWRSLRRARSAWTPRRSPPPPRASRRRRVAFGPRNLIDAVANGKRAARSIHEYLAHGRARRAWMEVEKIPLPSTRWLPASSCSTEAPTLDVGRRTRIAEVEIGYGDAEARKQRRAAWSATCRPSTTRRPASSAAAAWTSARRSVWPSFLSSSSRSPRTSGPRWRRWHRRTRTCR
jgi:NADPH-dependent glutamate synthase beta subunit-like oxidoreductase